MPRKLVEAFLAGSKRIRSLVENQNELAHKAMELEKLCTSLAAVVTEHERTIEDLIAINRALVEALQRRNEELEEEERDEGLFLVGCSGALKGTDEPN